MQLPTYIQLEPVGQCNLRCQMCSIQFRQDGPPYGPLAFMDGATSRTYERIRVRAHFDRVVGNLERLPTIRERLGRKLPHLILVAVIMRQNLHELPDLIRLAHQWSMERVFVQHLCHDFGESSLPSYYRPMRAFVQSETLLDEDPQRVAHYFGLAQQMAEELGMDVRLPHTEPRQHPPGTPGRERCSWPWDGAYVSYQGYAMPCCMVSTPDRINFGKIVEQGAEQT